MTINPGLDRRWFQSGGGLCSTIRTNPLVSQYIGLAAYADSAGNPHFTVGACQSLEGNSYVPVLEIDFAAALVRILGQVLIVP